MKILHSADWHLGKRLEQFSRLEEQSAVLAEICGIADEQNVDAVIIAGDLFDTFNPPTEAVDLFYKTHLSFLRSFLGYFFVEPVCHRLIQTTIIS